MIPSPEEIRAFLLKIIPKHPVEIITVTMEKFNVSRMTVHRHLNWLQQQNKIIKTGTTRKACYEINSSNSIHFSLKLTKALQEVSIWEAHMAKPTIGLNQSVVSILEYGFTEILNNAIDHSQGKKIDISFQRVGETLSLVIQDDGIGVFSRIKQSYHFDSYRECLLHLTKGKLTTDPINHTGEGIFFTSRIFDEFYLEANELCFYRNNLEKDWTLEKSDVKNGSKISMLINVNSTRKITHIFNDYTEQEDYAFVATDLLVDLSQLEGERLISRSQAKRLLSRLEPFTRIMLDFSKVKAIGQGFVDEIFRVYPLKNAQVVIRYMNANEEVEFMIKRGLPRP